MTEIPYLPPSPVGFPDPHQAVDDPEGLLAAGGDLTVDWLVEAYSRGIFPWFDDDAGPILWWSPAERAVLQPGTMRVTRSLAKRIRNAGFEMTVDHAFAEVIDGCRAPRDGQPGTWITQDMCDAYIALHAAGFAHSLETWLEGELVGGLYGVSLGRMFFGESMFSRANDASKVAFFYLDRLASAWSFDLIDCQMRNPHLSTLGVSTITRDDFLAKLRENDLSQTRIGNWSTFVDLATLNPYAGHERPSQ